MPSIGGQATPSTAGKNIMDGVLKEIEMWIKGKQPP